jgi:alginate O-acetyltransferase complex protein AlgJ
MKVVRCLFIFLFIICITIPLPLLDRKSSISMLERRVLPMPPKIRTNGKIDKKLLETLPRQIDAYITDRFAFRSKVITSIKMIDFLVLGRSHDHKLLVGKDKWLFYIDKSLGDEFANFKKSNLYNKAQMQFFLEQITMINDICEQNNIQFIFLIPPTTSSVYPEKYPFPRPEGMSIADQIIAALPENIRKKTIFPLDYFFEVKNNMPTPLYYNNGLHWTKLGAYYTYELLYKKLKAVFPNLPEIKFRFSPYVDPGEDNYALLWWGIKKFGRSLVMMNVEPTDKWESHYKYLVCNNVQENIFNTVVGNNSKKGKYGIITENKDKSLPTALIIRDSYFVDLEPFVSSIFSRVEYVWTQPKKRTIQYLVDLPKKPDVFIWEIAERGLEVIPLVPFGEFPGD